MTPGDRVTLAEHAHYREGRGLPGTVVQVWGHGRWATVDVDHHGEITLRTSELERPPLDGFQGAGVDPARRKRSDRSGDGVSRDLRRALGAAAFSVLLVALVTVLAVRA